MRVSLIVAHSTNFAIGKDGGLPWHLSEDLKRFKVITMGKPMIMGRLTYESIGRPLPGRQNIVLTRQSDFAAEGCDVVSSPEDALAIAGDAEEVMIIGGAGNCHLYVNHLEQANEQLSRETLPLPRLAIKRRPDSIFDYKYDDFEILNYESHPHISAAIAV